MNQFKQFGIKTPKQGMIGDKIKIDRILNRDITVYKYKITDSKYTDQCLHLQIGIGETKYVVFTGSGILIELIKQVPDEGFPFSTRIIKENDRLEFT